MAGWVDVLPLLGLNAAVRVPLSLPPPLTTTVDPNPPSFLREEGGFLSSILFSSPSTNPAPGGGLPFLEANFGTQNLLHVALLTHPPARAASIESDNLKENGKKVFDPFGAVVGRVKKVQLAKKGRNKNLIQIPFISFWRLILTCY